MRHAIDVIIPVYNEEEALPRFIERLLSISLPIHPILIDNGSTDNSLRLMQKIQDATIIEHRENRGYGASLRSGIQKATSEKIVIIDADGEYDPEISPQIVQQLDEHEVVHTSRFMDDTTSEMAKIRSLGNSFITTVFNLLFQQNLTDLYTGCKGYRLSTVNNLDLQCNGFEHVLEISARLVRKNIMIHELPIHYTTRKFGVSKMNHFWETLKYFFLVGYYFLRLPKK